MAKKARKSSRKIGKGTCKRVRIKGSTRCMCKTKSGRTKFAKKGRCKR